MPREVELQRNPSLAGGERDSQQAANRLETAATPAREAAAQEFVDMTPGSPPEGVQFDSGPIVDKLPSYADEDEEFLFGLSDFPEGRASGATSLRTQPPKTIYRYLSALAEAAEDPDAPPELHAFIRVLQDVLSEGTDDEPFPEMNFQESAQLDPSQVEDRRGEETDAESLGFGGLGPAGGGGGGSF